MLGLLVVFGLSVASEIVLDAKVPAALTIDGRVQAQLYYPGRLSVQVQPGSREVVVTVDGVGTTFSVALKDNQRQVIFAGRTGITMEDVAAPAKEETLGVEPVAIQLRGTGPAPVMLQLAGQRYVVSQQQPVDIALPPGEYPAQIRSGDGMLVYARGTLAVRAGEDLVVHLREGALPETSGDGLAFRPDRP